MYCMLLSYTNYCKIKLRTTILKHAKNKCIYRPTLKCAKRNYAVIPGLFTWISENSGDVSPDSPPWKKWETAFPAKQL